MMTEKYPTWLIGHVKEWAEKRLPTVILCSTTGNELLEVWYYGDLLTVKGEPQSYIVDGSPAPGLVAARDPGGDEEVVIFDGGRDGYDNMFCGGHDPSGLGDRPPGAPHRARRARRDQRQPDAALHRAVPARRGDD